MAKLGIRQRYHIVVPVLRMLLKENPEMAIAMRGALQKMAARGQITEGARKIFLEHVPVPLPSPAPAHTNQKEEATHKKSSGKERSRKVVEELFRPLRQPEKK